MNLYLVQTATDALGLVWWQDDLAWRCVATQDRAVFYGFGQLGFRGFRFVDHQSLEDNAVTVRDRDTWEQERVTVADLQDYLLKRLKA